MTNLPGHPPSSPTPARLGLSQTGAESARISETGTWWRRLLFFSGVGKENLRWVRVRDTPGPQSLPTLPRRKAKSQGRCRKQGPTAGVSWTHSAGRRRGTAPRGHRSASGVGRGGRLGPADPRRHSSTETLIRCFYT